MYDKNFYLTTGLITLALTSLGCATKNYVKAQLLPIDTKVAALDTKINQQAEKEQTDVSRLDEKILTTDYKATQAATAAQQANTAATQANQLAQQNQSTIASNQTANENAIAANRAGISNLDKALTYSLVAKADVTFGFDKSTLGQTDETALDALIQQNQSTPRVQIELIGFADQVGTAAYNLALSRRRSESVARYLVTHGIPLQGIHIIGLGKEPVPQKLLTEVQAVDPNATDANSNRLARRVLVRIYAPNGNVESASLK